MTDANLKSIYYAHSGRAPAGGVAVAIAGGAVVASLLALVYAYWDALIPFVYLNMFAAMIAGGVPGAVTGRLLKRGLVRNNRATTLAGFAVGFVALYVAWAAWPNALLDKGPASEIGFIHLLTNPAALWTTIISINRHGAWRMSGSTPTGLVLWVAWASEAAIIVGSSIFATSTFSTDEPFCETCQRWCVAQPRVLEAHGSDTGELKRRLEAKDFDYLAALGPRTRNDVEWFRLDLHCCKGCEDMATLTAKSVDLTVEGGRVSEKTILENLLVGRAEVERLRNFEFDAPRPRGV